MGERLRVIEGRRLLYESISLVLVEVEVIWKKKGRQEGREATSLYR